MEYKVFRGHPLYNTKKSKHPQMGSSSVAQLLLRIFLPLEPDGATGSLEVGAC